MQAKILTRITYTWVVLLGVAIANLGIHVNGDGFKKTDVQKKPTATTMPIMPATEKELGSARLEIIKKVKDTLFALSNERTISASGYQISRGYLRLVYDKFRDEAIIFWEEGWVYLEFNVNPRRAIRTITRRKGKDGNIYNTDSHQAIQKELIECQQLLDKKLSKNPNPVIVPSSAGNWILQGGFTSGGGISHCNDHTLFGSIGAPGVIPYLTDDGNKKKKGNKENEQRK